VISAKLILIDPGAEKRKAVRVRKLPMTVGRGRDADLTLAHPMVSRLHCELYETEGTLCLRDLESLNGTFVGDTRVTEVSLESGDILTIGSAKFELVIDAEDPILVPPQAEKEDPDDEAARATDIMGPVPTDEATPADRPPAKTAAPRSKATPSKPSKSPKPASPKRSAAPESPGVVDVGPSDALEDEVADILMDDDENENAKPVQGSDDDLNQFLTDLS
jgi:pSer/pThr/pTyr-binding forkhead associated (FHA) protein